MVGLEEINDAATRLAGVIRATPTAVSEPLSRVVGQTVYAKPEHLQRTGSFKIRGAYNFISRIADEKRATTVVAGSAGNHAQGVALAASLRNLRSVVFMPSNASLPKVEATRAYGAEVILVGASVDDCLEAARRYADEHEAVLVPPFDSPLVIAGQGTIGLELLHEVPDAGTVLVPVGGGGLISGIAAALRLSGSKASIIGVEASGGASMSAALSETRPVRLEAVHTMADGIAVGAVSQLTLEHVAEFVDDVICVEEEEISKAVLVLLERCKWVVEPAGAVGLAALVAGKVPTPRGGPVVTLFTGGNIDPLLLTRLIEHGLSAAGRYLMLHVILSDTPGELARLTGAVAELGMNVITVEHHRSGAMVGLDEVEVLLTVETRDPTHRDRVVPELTERGFRVVPPS